MTPTTAILASLAASPPPQRYVRGTLGPNDGEMRPCGKRVADLRRLYMAEFEAMLADYDAGRISRAAMRAIPTIDAVVRAAPMILAVEQFARASMAVNSKARKAA